MWWFYVLLFIALWIWWKLSKDPRRNFNPWPRQFVAAHLKSSYDFIVVGAGSSGSVLASRLAQGRNGKKPSVLLIEAGEECHRQTRCRNSVNNWFGLLYSDIDWDFGTVAQKGLNGRKIAMNRGKTTGGSSAINASMWVRGCKEDYDGWKAAGCEGWGWQDVLPHFMSLESYKEGDPKVRGHNGPVEISVPGAKSPTHISVVEAAKKAGYAYTDDYNTGRLEGIAFTQESMSNEQRNDAFSRFVEPLLGKVDLTVVSSAFVKRIVFRDLKAVAVRVQVEGRNQTITAEKEIILSAGAISTPQLLLLSGIGPKKHLKNIGIPIVYDNSYVGKNLQDHVTIPVVFESKKSVPYSEGGCFGSTMFYQSSWSKKNTPKRGEDIQVVTACGPVYNNAGLVSVVSALLEYDILHSMQGKMWRNLLFLLRKWNPAFLKKSTSKLLGLAPVLNQPTSRGSVKLRSPDPHDHPLIDPNGLDTPEDVERIVEGIKKIREIAAQDPLRGICSSEHAPGKKCTSDKDIEDFIRSKGFYAWHPVGTCKMGTGNDAVVDPQLKVRGVKGLRVADASIMPFVVSGNTNQACEMIGAKAADLLLTQYCS